VNEILIELYVPSLGKRFDVFIPASAKVYEIAGLVVSAVTKLADGMFVPRQAVLCGGDNGQPLDASATPAELKLQNGSQLLLI
jgi:hypothetical protein